MGVVIAKGIVPPNPCFVGYGCFGGQVSAEELIHQEV